MKHRKWHAVILLMVTISFVTLVTQSLRNVDAIEVNESTEDSTIYLPSIMESMSPLIPETTVILTEITTDELISVSSDGVTYTSDQMTPELTELNGGDVMIGDVSDTAPHGFLRRVTNVTQSGGDVIVITEASTLEDAIQPASISHGRRLSPNDVTNSVLTEGVSLLSPAADQGDQFVYSLLDVVLYDLDGDLGTANDQVTVNGSFNLETSYEFALTIEDWTIENLSFVRIDTETAELIVEADVAVNVKEEKQIASHLLHQSRFSFRYLRCCLRFLLYLFPYLK